MQREENRCVASPPAAGVNSIVRAPAQIFRCHWRPQRPTAIFLPASRHQCAKRVCHLCEKHLAKFATTTFFISFSASNTLRNKGHCRHCQAVPMAIPVTGVQRSAQGRDNRMIGIKADCHRHSHAQFLLCNLLVWHRGAECLAACQCDQHFAAILSRFQL